MSKTQFKPTEEQQAVIEAVAGKDSVMVDALAGCTKTTSLEMAAPGVKVPALGLAFNKKIAQELTPRMPQNFTIKTFNGWGFGACMRANPGAPKAQIEERKLGKIISQIAKDRKVELSMDQWDEMRRLVSAAMQAGITPGDRGRPLCPDTVEAWWNIADDLWITQESFEFIYEMCHEALERDIALLEKNGLYSFDDQVYYSACIAGQFPKYPVIFVDEAQDLSPLNHAMLAQSVREDGRLVVVGDPKQAIYGFRGADSRSMGKIRALRPEGSWADRGLLTTFRCPKAIVVRQQQHAPGYKAWHTNPEGRYTRLREGEPGFRLEEGWNWNTIRALLPHDRCSIGVLCRNNGPLLALAFKLIKAQVGVTMLGRDIGKGLIGLSRKIEPEDSTSILHVVGKISDWIETETSLARANGHEEKVAGITDRGECLLATAEAGPRDAGELRAMLERLFSREAGQVQLGSIHRWKGLEADAILHLDPWRIPSKWATQAAKAGDPRQLEQEWNLKYVAETRTKHTLIAANLEDFQ